MFVNLPKWANKPNHKEEVIATNKGWEVKRTGEVLVSIKGLAGKLAELRDALKNSMTVVEATIDSDTATIIEDPIIPPVDNGDDDTTPPVKEPEPEPEQQASEPKPTDETVINNNEQSSDDPISEQQAPEPEPEDVVTKPEGDEPEAPKKRRGRPPKSKS